MTVVSLPRGDSRLWHGPPSAEETGLPVQEGPGSWSAGTVSETQLRRRQEIPTAG